MTAKCINATNPRPASRTVGYVVQNCLLSDLLLDRSYNGVIKTLRAVYS